MKKLLYASLIVLPFGKALSIPLMESNGKLISLYPFDILTGCLVMACLLHYGAKRHAASRRPSIAGPLTWFTLWAAFSLLLNSAYFHLSFKDTFFGSLYLVRWAQYAAFYYAALEIVTADPHEADKLLKYVVGGALAFSIFGVIQSLALPNFALMLNPSARPYIDFDPQGHRLVSTFLDPNISAGYIIFFALLALSFYMNGHKRWLGAFLTFFVALILTLSRGGLLGFFVGAAALILITGGRQAKRAMIATAVLIVVLAVAMYPALAPQLAEAERLSLTDASAMMRVQDWLTAIDIIRSNPFTGIGFNTFGFISPLYGLEREGGMAFGIGGDLIMILTLTGIIGFLLYLRICFNLLRVLRTIAKGSASSRDQILAKGILAGLTGMLVSSCFTTIILYPEIVAIIWTCVGIIYARLGAVALPAFAAGAPPVRMQKESLLQVFARSVQHRVATTHHGNSA